MNCEDVHIPCIGIDDKIHYCKPHEDVTLCGMKIKRKNVSEKEYNTNSSCFECTY